MKKCFNLLLSATLFLPVAAFSQNTVVKAAQLAQAAPEDTVKNWHVGGLINISFTQASFTNWAAGGVNSLGLASMLSFHANYRNEKFSWLNDIQLGYGFQKQDEQKLQKTTDQIAVTSSVGYKVFDHTSLTFLTNFQSQFQPGYTNAADTVLLSDFMSPAYWVLALGLNYSPVNTLHVFLSPITARFTFVENQQLADAGAFGVDPAVYNALGVKTQNGKNISTAVGAYFKGDFRWKLMDNIALTTNLELFSDYLKDPQNIVVNWTTFLQLKVNKYISATLNTQLIYDNTIAIPIYKDEGGVSTLIGKGPRTQFKDVLGVGFAYNL